jgi:VWFA-related protein
MNRHAMLAAVLSLCSVSGQAQAPTFRTETTVVQLPVRVLDAKGSFVRDLAPADIEVLEDGVPQQVSDFTLVDLSTSAKQPPRSATPQGGTLTVPQLESLEGRLYVFLLDDYHLNVLHTPRAKNLVRDFIRDRMLPGDAAAIILASGAARQDFTHDKRLLLAVLDRATGTFDGSEPLAARELKARSIVKLVADLGNALAQIRGRHKSLIYVGQQVGCRISLETSRETDIPITGDQPQTQREQVEPAFASTAQEQILCNEQMLDGVRAAVQANVSIYAIDPRGSYNPAWVSPSIDGRGGPDPARQRMAAAEPGRPSIFDGFYVLSDHTGGFAVTGTGNYRDPLDRIVRESSTYYLLAYTSSNNKIDGKYRRTQIKVKRPGVEAFYRPGYMARRQ